MKGAGRCSGSGTGFSSGSFLALPSQRSSFRAPRSQRLTRVALVSRTRPASRCGTGGRGSRSARTCQPSRSPGRAQEFGVGSHYFILQVEPDLLVQGVERGRRAEFGGGARAGDGAGAPSRQAPGPAGGPRGAAGGAAYASARWLVGAVRVIPPSAGRSAQMSTHHVDQDGFHAVLEKDIDWQPFPGFPAAARLAVMVGRPPEPEPYAVRVKLPAGEKLMPLSAEAAPAATSAIAPAPISEAVRRSGLWRMGMEYPSLA